MDGDTDSPTRTNGSEPEHEEALHLVGLADDLMMPARRALLRSAAAKEIDTMTYDAKFAKLIEMCAKAKHDKLDAVMIHHPQVLGDSYDEMVESMNRIADAGLMIQIVPRSERDNANAPS